jgi:hypothetical protein
MSLQCEKLNANLKNCNCTYQGCSRRGNCCACLEYHLGMRELPACAFPPDVEKTWDRSFERFIKTHG